MTQKCIGRTHSITQTICEKSKGENIMSSSMTGRLVWYCRATLATPSFYSTAPFCVNDSYFSSEISASCN